MCDVMWCVIFDEMSENQVCAGVYGVQEHWRVSETRREGESENENSISVGRHPKPCLDGKHDNDDGHNP